MEYLKVWTSFRKDMEELQDAEKGRLFDAMLLYAETGEESELKGAERILWPSAKNAIDRTAAKNKKLKSNGEKGGRPNKNKDNQTKANETKDNQTEPTETKDNQTKAYKRNNKENNPLYSLPLMSSEEATEIQRAHNQIMERMEYVGFDMSRSVIDQVINCFADHGLEVVLDALDECAGVQGNKLRYFNRVIENLGKQKPSRDDADRESEELDEIYRKTENMLRELEEG